MEKIAQGRWGKTEREWEKSLLSKRINRMLRAYVAVFVLVLGWALLQQQQSGYFVTW